MRRALHLSTAALIAATSLFSVAAGDGDCRLARGAETADSADDLTVCREDVWFHQAETKAGNLAGTEHGSLPTFDTNAPESSVAMGAGGGYVGTSAHQGSVAGAWDPAYSPTFVGEYTGAIDTLLVDMYLFPPASMVDKMAGDGSTAPWRVDMNLTVGGQTVLTLGDVAFELEDGGNAVQRARFAITNILNTFLDSGVSLTDANDVKLEIVGTGLATNGAIWVFDTTEVPSGMSFNIDPADIPEGVFVHDMEPVWF